MKRKESAKNEKETSLSPPFSFNFSFIHAQPMLSLSVLHALVKSETELFEDTVSFENVVELQVCAQFFLSMFTFFRPTVCFRSRCNWPFSCSPCVITSLSCATMCTTMPCIGCCCERICCQRHRTLRGLLSVALFSLATCLFEKE